MSKRSSPTDALTGSTGAGAAPPEPNVAKRTRSSGGASAATAAPPAVAASPPLPTGVTFSTKDSAQQLSYSRDALEVTGSVGGYRMARATDGVFSGNWYWEAEVLLAGEEELQGQAQAQAQEGGGKQQKTQEGTEDGDGAASQSGKGNGNGADSGSAPHFRLGWALRQADMQAPCGYDKNSYGYRDLDGAKVHKSLREDGYGEPYGPGDVIGFGICLPILPEHMQEILALNDGVLPAYMRGTEDGGGRADDAAEARAGAAQPPLSKEEKEALEKELAALGNHIRFFKNGVDQGPAYSQLIGAKYFPAVSLYNEGGRVRANFGPTWICDPRAHGCRFDFRPVSAVKEPLRKEELAAYLGYIEARRAAWRARHGVKEELQQGGEQEREVKPPAPE